jgi:hypothetical protein
MIDSRLTQLIYNCGDMLDFPRAVGICHLVYHVNMNYIPGDFCEFGVYKGHTAALIAAVGQRRICLYDSFKGLPEKSPKDITRSDFVPGYLRAEPDDVHTTFKEALVDTPRVLIPGWFKDLKPWSIPERVAFAHIDADFYQSTLDALKLVWPKMSQGGIVVVDDCGNPDLPGVWSACEEFFDFPIVSRNGHGWFTKP